MRSTFENDPYLGKTRILFIGHPLSTHVYSWIDLLAHSQINVRFFSIPFDAPPTDWPIRTYLASPSPPRGLNLDTRKCLYPTPEQAGTEVAKSYPDRRVSPEGWLAEIVTYWRPHIVHVFGIDPASFSFSEAMNGLDRSECDYTWVIQTRGGSDLTLTRTDPEVSPRIRKVLEECDQIITDNKKNFEYLQELGVPIGKIAEIAPVPGTGGIDIEKFADARKTPPSKRERIILWPKAYECPWSKALPVLEAIKEAWEKIKPCKICMLASIQAEVRQWFYALPREIQDSCHIDDRIPRDELLELMRRTRVMLAPSLVDGIPNSLYEAMACGAFPIVSPLDTISTAVRNEENVLFARNLYPSEIAEALVRAMSEDHMVDQAASNNVEILKTYADRSVIKRRVVNYYESLTKSVRLSEGERLPLVSIITPAYNRASFLDETIQSVLSQGYPNLEYIILDDGSKDNTREVLAKYGDRIYWESHENMGEARTVNRGFQLANGDLICVVNSDDPLFGGAVSNAVTFMQSRPEILVAYPDWDYIAPDSQPLGHVQVPEYDFLFMVAHHKCIVGPGAFIRREAVELIGGRDHTFKYVGDFEFWLRLALKGPFARIPKTLATFRVHPTSASLAMKSAEMAREDIRMIRKFYSRADLPSEILNIKNIAFSSAHLHASRVSGPARFHSLMHFIAFMAYSPRNFAFEYPTAVARLRPDFYGRGIKNSLGRVIHRVVSTMPFVRR